MVTNNKYSKKTNAKRTTYQNNIKNYYQAKLEIQRKKRNLKILVTVSVILLIIMTLVLITKPSLVLNGKRKVEIFINQEYKDLGVKARSMGRDVKNRVKVENDVNTKKAGIYHVTYTIKYLNSTIDKTRTIIVKDNIKPEITLNGNEVIYLEVNSKYEELGYKAIDNNDGDITHKVKVENNINLNKTGTYNIKYKVSDANGNKTEVIRTVIVVKKSDPNLKTIYLTFDDGPSSITPQVLDILKQNDVKATFFVIGKPENYDNIIRRIHSEGHTIAIHSNTHDYKYIYSSEDAYFEDLNTLRNHLKNITGVAPNVIRFPGGSSNTVSYYNKGIMSRLTIQVMQKGFAYFDWNIDSGDTGRIGSDAIVENVTSSLGDYHTYVVLMHDYGANQQTADALDRIIKYGKSKGYRFDKLTTDTPVVHHGVNN